ncbi:MAG: DUF177 domain-containing protein [Betaproteobacteria bacterium]|nr:DUF177 domain-containing protein [Betaproteobacteria bacterium]
MPRRPVIDGLEFARAGSKLQASWPVSDFPRLRDGLNADSGKIDCELEGIQENLGRRALRLRLSGTLQLTCQRCLGALAQAVRVDEVLLLAESQAEIDAEPVNPEAPERILAGREMQVHELVEDELVLALPIAPRHERCAGEKPGAAATKQSPFAGLKDLMHGGRH